MTMDTVLTLAAAGAIVLVTWLAVIVSLGTIWWFLFFRSGLLRSVLERLISVMSSVMNRKE